MQLRAQYMVALATHQAVGHLEELTNHLKAAYNPNAHTQAQAQGALAGHGTPPTTPTTHKKVTVLIESGTAWFLQLFLLLAATDCFKYLGQVLAEVIKAIKGMELFSVQFELRGYHHQGGQPKQVSSLHSHPNIHTFILSHTQCALSCTCNNTFSHQ